MGTRHSTVPGCLPRRLPKNLRHPVQQIPPKATLRGNDNDCSWSTTSQRVPLGRPTGIAYTHRRDRCRIRLASGCSGLTLVGLTATALTPYCLSVTCLPDFTPHQHQVPYWHHRVAISPVPFGWCPVGYHLGGGAARAAALVAWRRVARHAARCRTPSRYWQDCQPSINSYAAAGQRAGRAIQDRITRLLESITRLDLSGTRQPTCKRVTDEPKHHCNH